MNLEFLIARRIFNAKTEPGQSRGVRAIVAIAITAVSLSIAVMLASIAIVNGFSEVIREKIVGFGGHTRITAFDNNFSYEQQPISPAPALYSKLKDIEGVRAVQSFITKPAILKTSNDIEGVVLKGIAANFDWDFFKSRIIEGEQIHFSDTSPSKEAMISRITAQRLKLKVGDNLYLYFIQNPPRARKLKVGAIYETGLEEFDRIFVFCDLSHLQKLNNWSKEEIGGYEVLINDFENLEPTTKKIYASIPPEMNALSIKELYPQLFDWLGLQDMNAVIIIILMVVVAGMNMITALLITIRDRTNMIGVLKAIGADNVSIRRIFIYLNLLLTGRGLLIGNLMGLGFCAFQYFTGVLKLDQESYFISQVPISFPWLYFILVNLGTLLVCGLMMLIPSRIIAGISPVKAIRFN